MPITAQNTAANTTHENKSTPAFDAVSPRISVCTSGKKAKLEEFPFDSNRSRRYEFDVRALSPDNSFCLDFHEGIEMAPLVIALYDYAPAFMFEFVSEVSPPISTRMINAVSFCDIGFSDRAFCRRRRLIMRRCMSSRERPKSRQD